MNANTKSAALPKDRSRERGAALVTVLMLSFLLLTATAGLLLEASMNTANVTDATSEEQAYYAAESGIQSVIDALRHNPRPSPLLNPSATPLPPDPAADESNQITYARAVRKETSNATNPDSATCAGANPPPDCVPRLSRWIRYNWGPNGGTGDPNPDRVVLGGNYSVFNGFAYSVTVTDPDNTAGIVSYSINAVGNGILDTATGTYLPSRTFGTGADLTTITYTPPVGLQTVDVSTGIGNHNIGTFTMTQTGSGGAIPSGNDLVRFKITLAVSQPQNTSVVVRGYIVPPGTALEGEEGPPAGPNCTRTGVSYLFDSKVFLSFGSRTTLTSSGCVVEERASKSGPFGTFLTGYLVPAVSSLPLNVSITRPEPTRLLIRSTGYGPKGARKELEAVIQKNYFNGLGAPAPLLLIGSPCNTATGLVPCVAKALPATDFRFDPGNSNVVKYSGKDKKLKAFLPPIGLTNEPNRIEVRDIITGFNGKVFGTAENVASELPHWLQNPANLDKTVQLLKAAAQASGSYWGPTSSPPQNATGVYGDWASATGITFIDKDVRISGNGGGILVVNGRLNFHGNFKWNGLVLVIGPKTSTSNGGFLRDGGGEGELAGNFIVAPYDSWSLNTCMPNPSNVLAYQNKLNCFHAPTYEISGGGNSDLLFNSQNVTSGLGGLGNFVKGVAEK